MVLLNGSLSYQDKVFVYFDKEDQHSKDKLQEEQDQMEVDKVKKNTST